MQNNLVIFHHCIKGRDGEREKFCDNAVGVTTILARIVAAKMILVIDDDDERIFKLDKHFNYLKLL